MSNCKRPKCSIDPLHLDMDTVHWVGSVNYLIYRVAQLKWGQLIFLMVTF